MDIYDISQFYVGLSRVKSLALTGANVQPSLQIIKLLRIWLATRTDEETLCEVLPCPQAWKCEIYPVTNKAVFDAVTHVVCLQDLRHGNLFWGLPHQTSQWLTTSQATEHFHLLCYNPTMSIRHTQ